MKQAFVRVLVTRRQGVFTLKLPSHKAPTSMLLTPKSNEVQAILNRLCLTPHRAEQRLVRHAYLQLIAHVNRVIARNHRKA
jgi:hypothetical protein